MRVSIRWRDLLGYFRTWSSLQNFHERFPEDLEKTDERFPKDQLSQPIRTENRDDTAQWEQSDVDVSGGDIAIRFWKDLRDEVRRHGGKYGVDDVIVVEWPIALLLARRA